MVISGLTTQFGPTYVFITKRIRTTTTDLKMPFIDENSPYQFTLNFALQFVFSGHGGFIFYGIEITVIILENAIRAAPKLIQHELLELIYEYKQNAISKTQLRSAFRNTIIQCADVLRWNLIQNLVEQRNFIWIPRNYSIAPILFDFISCSCL